MKNMKTSIERRAPFMSPWLAAALAVILGFCLPARASLGGDVNSVEADRAHMNASINVTQAEAYAVHEMKAPTGTVVREYMSEDGRVFGVAWQGPSIPDMKQLLGTYFEQYVAAAKAARAARRGRGPLNIQQPGLVFQNSGHMRAFSGRAYDPGLIPQGVSANEIR
jgi:hypothetical protein